MTRTQIIQWIVLPNGIWAEGQLRVSIFVSPRLRSDEGETLAQFPDFVDWAARMVPGQVQFEIERADGVRLAPEMASPPPNPDLWGLLFDENTPLKPFEFDDFADRPMVSYPVNQLLNYFKHSYANLAAQTTDDLPFNTKRAGVEDRNSLQEHLQELVDDHGKIGVFQGSPDPDELARRIGDVLRPKRAEAYVRRKAAGLQMPTLVDPYKEFAGYPAGNFYKANVFHRRTRRKPVDFPKNGEQAQRHFKERSDFHQMLSTLGDYPLLLRWLGLAFDLLLPADALDIRPSGATPQPLRAHVTFTSAFPERSNPEPDAWTLSVHPATNCLNTDDLGIRVFTAAPRAGLQDMVYGLMQVDPPDFTLGQVDVDGLVLKVSSLLPTLRRQIDQPNRPIEEPDKSGLPALRTGGLGLIHTRRPEALHKDFYQARRNNHDLEQVLDQNPPNPPALWAEDLTRGMRVDIYDDQSAAWHSLHMRQGDYVPRKGPASAISGQMDEGIFQVGVSSELDAPDDPVNEDKELYVHENLVTWDGWSLSVPRPGDKVAHEPAPPDPEPGVTPLPLETNFSVQRESLPKLRFGRRYGLRLRAVDLAGNGLDLNQADTLLEALRNMDVADAFPVTSKGELVPYRRFEPVPPPDLVARHPLREGEGLERLVIRSDYDRSSAEYPAVFANEHPDLAGDGYLPFCDRFIAAPKASLQMAETHGMFDAQIDAARAHGHGSPEWNQAAHDTYQAATRESGSFREAPGAEIIVTGKEREVEQSYAIIDADEIELPYLPDPFAAGAVLRFRGIEGQPDSQIIVRYQARDQWYTLRPFRLRLEEGSAPPQFDPLANVMTVQLPRGRTAVCSVNSLFKNDLNLLGILGWCEEVLDPSSLDKVVQAIKESRHWMITPWRELSFVHAVQRPLGVPKFTIINLEQFEHNPYPVDNIFNRKLHPTRAYLNGVVTIDIPSTAQVDLLTDWREPQDDPSKDRAKPPLYNEAMPQHKRAVMSLGIPDTGQALEPSIQEYLAFEEGTPKLVFNTTWDQRPAQIERDLLQRTLLALHDDEDEPQRDSLRRAIVQLDQLLPHEFGDTKYRKVNYRMTAASRFREYFPPGLATDPANVSREGEMLTVHMLSTSAPAKPVVFEVVPLMRWEETQTPDGTQLTSTRQGAGLRVWLERPWFSSGEGELLAVVFGNMIHTLTDPLYPYVTLWGQDPVHASVLPVGPWAASFGQHARVVAGLFLQEQVPDHVSAAVFEPAFDKESNRWYCDIEIDTGAAYFPFVRLALARYQPMSQPGAELSPVVLADITQMLPDRSLSIIHDAGDASTLHLALRGPAPQARRDPNGNTVPGTNLVTAQVEQQAPGFNDPALGWATLGEEISLMGTVEADGHAVWRGNISLPPHEPNTLRLVVKEFELHPSDSTEGVSRRLVHFDVQKV